MILSRDALRALLLQLPEVEAGEHHGKPDLRVSRRIIASFSTDSSLVVLKTTPLNLDMLLRNPDPPYQGMSGGRWVGVDIERAPAHEVAELAIEAYCLAAPIRLAAGVRANPRPVSFD